MVHACKHDPCVFLVDLLPLQFFFAAYICKHYDQLFTIVLPVEGLPYPYVIVGLGFLLDDDYVTIIAAFVTDMLDHSIYQIFTF